MNETLEAIDDDPRGVALFLAGFHAGHGYSIAKTK
jgi:hypothetical protein